MKAWQVFGPIDLAPFLDQLHRNAARKKSKLENPAAHPDDVKVRSNTQRWPRSSLNWLP